MNIDALRQIAADAPDSKFIYIDGGGDEWFAFDVCYEVDGSEFCFRIWARNFADAERRILALKATAKLEGQVISEFPYSVGGRHV